MTSTFFGIYVALGVLFYSRLIATATDGNRPERIKPSSWHRVRHLTKAFLRRMTPTAPKH